MQDQYLITWDHPIVNNHSAYDQQLFPGLAYIDLIYQFFREHGYDFAALQLSNLSIYAPLAVKRDTELLLNIQCIEREKGNWQIKVEGQEQNEGTPKAERNLYVTAEMLEREQISFNDTLNFSQIQREAIRKSPLEDSYVQCQRRELIHTGIMKAEGTIYEGKDSNVIEIGIGSDALASAEGFMFHPALIDGSGVGSGVLFDSLDPDELRLFLPIHYESFCASDLLGTRCLTRIQKSGKVRKKELHYVTLEFFNETGKKIAELKKYAGKLVRAIDLINPDRAQERKTSTTFDYGHVCSEYEPQLQSPAISVNSAIQEAEMVLREILSVPLNKPVNQIPIHVGYYEMGLVSSSLLEVVGKIQEKLSVDLNPTLLFEYTTISELAEYLSGEYPNRFRTSREVDTGYPSSKSAKNETDHRVKSNAESFKISTNETARVHSNATMDVAIIGMAGRYPKSENLTQFWSNLIEGRDCISEVPIERWDWRDLEGIRSPSGKAMSKWGGFIDEVDCFDPQFFRISPREAEMIDPQERLFLQICWETIEDAGYTPKLLVPTRGKNKRRQVGVFAGVMHKDYTILQAEAVAKGHNNPLSLNYASIANRVSYSLNFHGPSLTVDTVCSSSLVAIHLAVESIRHGESDIALAGGVNLSLHPNKYLTYGMMDMHASDGLCHTFGSGGDGYVSGEGIGAVLLKPLQMAIRDNDRIYAVIKGSTVNHVGAVSGITVPSPVAQADMIEACLEKTNVDPRTISYVEAHGTGTSLGDPIEIQGLTKAFRAYTKDNQFCSIGSVKSNIGHAESAAGISGLHKVVLQLHHKTLVPSLHASESNPYIDFASSPFFVQQHAEAWKRPELYEEGQKTTYPRRAGLSSFGAYGTNAHLIFEEYVPEIEQPVYKKNGPYIVPLSAHTNERLLAYAKKMYDFLEKNEMNQQVNIEKNEIELSRMRQLERKIKQLLARMIHVDEDALETEADWGEYGVEPVELHRLQGLIHKDLGLETDADELLAAGSIAGIATLLLREYPDGDYVSDMFPEAIEHVYEENLNLEIRPEELAYTMQIGREAMEERVVFIVRDLLDLRSQLEAYLRQNIDASHFHQGNSMQNGDMVSLFATDEDADGLIRSWFTKGKWDKLAELWAKGVDIDWSILYEGIVPHRIGLPTYPFAKDRYWIRGLRDKPAKKANPAPLQSSQTADHTEPNLLASVVAKEISVPLNIVNNKLLSAASSESKLEKPRGIVLSSGSSILTDQSDASEVQNASYPMHQSRDIPEQLSRLEHGNDQVETNDLIGVLNTPVIDEELVEYAQIDHDNLREKLKTTLADALYMKPTDIDSRKKFVDMGLDSIVGVEWIQVLNKIFGIPILATRVYDYPTLDEFAAYLISELGQNKVGNQKNSLSMDEILEHVHQGKMNIEQANILLQEVN